MAMRSMAARLGRGVRIALQERWQSMETLPAAASESYLPREMHQGHRLLATKGEMDGELKRRTNDEIDSPMVRLVHGDSQHEVISTQEALEKAKSAGLDLVEVSPGAQPPVVRIADFGEMQRQKRVKDREQTKKMKEHQRHEKAREIRITPRISAHDLELKIKKITEFLEKKQKVLVVMMAPTAEDKKLGHDALQYIRSILADKAKLGSESQAGLHRTISMTFLPAHENKAT